jgi:nucleotide-binding universal stress UspA family protein
MDIKKMLFVTKFEELWFDALQSLLDLNKAALNHVVFLHVIQRDKVAMRRGAGYQKEEEIKLREMANIRFIDWAEHLFEQGMEAGVYIVVGNFAPQVISAAKKEAADLIVIGPEKKGRLEKLYSGSDIMEIIRSTASPVLVYSNISEDRKITESPFASPLLATNWTDADQRSVEYLKGLSNVVKEIDIIHVADEKSLDGSSAMGVQKTRKQARQKLEEICDILEAGGINAKPHVYIGETVSEVEKAARECRSTMIIAGVPAKSAWKERLLGRTSKALAENSMFPVLLVPALQIAES